MLCSLKKKYLYCLNDLLYKCIRISAKMLPVIYIGEFPISLFQGAVNPVVSGAHSLTGTQSSTSTGATVGGANGFYLPSEDKIPNNVSKMSTHSSGKNNH